MSHCDHTRLRWHYKMPAAHNHILGHNSETPTALAAVASPETGEELQIPRGVGRHQPMPEEKVYDDQVAIVLEPVAVRHFLDQPRHGPALKALDFVVLRSQMFGKGRVKATNNMLDGLRLKAPKGIPLTRQASQRPQNSAPSMPTTSTIQRQQPATPQTLADQPGASARIPGEAPGRSRRGRPS